MTFILSELAKNKLVKDDLPFPSGLILTCNDRLKSQFKRSCKRNNLDIKDCICYTYSDKVAYLCEPTDINKYYVVTIFKLDKDANKNITINEGLTSPLEELYRGK